MGLIRIVKMRFDLTNEYDAATYQRLAESAKRGYRRDRGMQAHYLASVMLGVRPYGGLRNAGLTEQPQFSPELDERLDDFQARIQKVEDRMSTKLSRKQDRAPVLRLVPSNSQGRP
ncbi:MAG: hypothetical protein K2Q17_00035 [Nitrospiraceae bacterium]|jgi:hypothetical protein|uniref:hypothetical protein n=1 Tax=Nitrospira cf. moscoviensis SBR1015 TaxID=96242 RepID=UPI000A0E7256|nr:hypothetical protein [Nitrospira cf. moscoviensis SBR1015]MBY0246023.1 hypothetical protein [Nitrospiraceae bacterium]OQW34044.1 MAG: hypothetical protein A4E20_18235 [Nitrospira sp. SG-bin2]